jgi:two-component system, NarL family, nitrate/nitrite response regulator NarL
MSQAGSKQIRVLLVDDHTVVRTGLRMIIESRPNMLVIGEAANRADAISLAASQLPDIILLDLDLGDDSGMDVIPEMRAASKARIIILTGMRDREAHRQAIMLGAMGVVQKGKAVEDIINAIERVHAGEAWLDPAVMASVLNEMSGAGRTQKADPEAEKIATLTNREREVVALIGEGLKNKDIAERLFISETTVRHHLTSIFDKLEVSDRVELLIYAYRHGLANPPK